MRIRNASDTPLDRNPGTLPNVSGALSSYFQKMVAKKVTKSVDNFEVKEDETDDDTDLTFMGVIQSFSNRQLSMKPEGQRAWRWFMIHATADFVLDLDDEFIINGRQYRIMRQGQFDDYGFVVYEIVEDYQG